MTAACLLHERHWQSKTGGCVEVFTANAGACVKIQHLDDFPDWAGRGGVPAGHLVVEDEQPPLEVGDVLLVCTHRAPPQQRTRHSTLLWLVRGTLALWHGVPRALSAPVASRRGDRRVGAEESHQ